MQELRTLLEKYQGNAPRYTSYPTALELREGDWQDLAQATWETSAQAGRPLSYYVHVPYCDSLCYYCGCHRIITRNPDLIAGYHDAVLQEIDAVGDRLGMDREIVQIHFGGGTPTTWSDVQLGAVARRLRALAGAAADDIEQSIEVDPRTLRPERVAGLAAAGFNRISLGVQDFEPAVQEAIGRIQSYEETRAVVDAAREADFDSVNVDLIYGLPLQTQATMARTLDQVLTLQPDRISLFHYAHMPSRFAAQKLLPEDKIPSRHEKLELFMQARDTLLQSGYVFIGMDHFAKADDELSLALDNGTLWRNFQGYTTREGTDLVGFGVSSISMFDDAFLQNMKHSRNYRHAVADGKFPLEKALTLTAEDRLRRDIIMEIMCHFSLDLPAIAQRYNLKPEEKFAAELAQLTRMEADGLLQSEGGRMQLTEAGRYMVRLVAQVFDAYRPLRTDNSFSQAV